MATKRTVVPSAEKWTEKEANDARRLMQKSLEFSGNFLTRYDAASKALFKGLSYSQLPEGVRSFISHRGGKASARGKKEAEVVTVPATPVAITADDYRRVSRGDY
jgi:hypothetical protein